MSPGRVVHGRGNMHVFVLTCYMKAQKRMFPCLWMVYLVKSMILAGCHLFALLVAPLTHKAPGHII